MNTQIRAVMAKKDFNVKYTYLKILMLMVFATTSFQTQAEEQSYEPVENNSELTEKDVSAQNWDETLEKVKKRRGFKRVADRLDELGDKGAEQLDKLFSRLDQISIEFTVKDKIEIIDGLQISGGYEYEAGPAFYGDFFQRIDGYRIGFPISFLDLVGIESEFGIRAEPEVEVRFMQFFDDINDARKPKNGYLPNKVPVTAQKALELKPGDLVMIDGRLNFAYGIGKVWDEILDWLTFSIRGSSQVNGLFRAFVFRGNNDMVRVRVSALRDSPKVVSGKFSVFDLFDLGWSRLTELVERALRLEKLIEGQRQWIDRDLWIADYTLDLGDPAVARAFNTVFERKGRYRGIMKLANPFKRRTDESRQKTRNELFELLAPITDSVINNPNKDSKSIVNFMGSNYSNGGLTEIEAGLRGLARSGILTSKKENRLKQTVFDADGVERENYFFFPSWIKRTELSGCGTLCRERKHQAANIIYTADENFNIQEFQNIGFYREETDKAYSYKEHVKLLESFQRILPPDLFQEFLDELADKGWGKFSGNRQNVRVSARYFINKEGLERVAFVTEPIIQKFLIDALREMDEETKVMYEGEQPHGSVLRDACPMKELRKMGVRTWRERNNRRKDNFVLDMKNGRWIGQYTYKYCKQIKSFSERLAQSLRPGLSAEARHKIFTKFTESGLFRKLGPGILFDILGAGSRDISDLTFFEIVLNRSGGKDAVRFRRGEIENRPLYEIILQMERILNEDEPDLRFPGDVESPVERIIDAS